MTIRSWARGLAAALLILAASGPATAQLGGLGGLGDKLKKKAGIENPLAGKPPITTSLEDAKWGEPTKDGFTPPGPKQSLTTLQRTPAGGFVLRAGYYTMETQSYCLKAGTHGPGGGDGYLYAPTEGPAEEAVMSILRNSTRHPEIAQQKIQTLLWAIIARAKFEDLSTEHKAVASQLLTPRQLAMLNRGALDMIPGPAMNAMMAKVPGPVRTVMEAEAKLRQMLTSPGTSFAELERVAVLAGAAPMGEGSIGVPSGRWSLHPDGYYVRYLPRGYSHTLLEIWVPEGAPGVNKDFDPATHIAVPGNTARQRLVQSGRVHS